MHLTPAAPRDEQLYYQMVSRGSGAVDGPEQQQQQQQEYEDPLGDVFGSDSEHGDGDGAPGAGPAAPDTTTSADLRRLQSTHVTVGYREGILVGKAGSIQAGFDAGYGLGAQVGLKAGQLLGLLEGVATAVAGGGAQPRRQSDGEGAGVSEKEEEEEAPETARRLLYGARADLCTQRVFDQEFWHPDGTQRFDVPAAAAEGEEAIADAHPLIRKWTEQVERQIQAWGLVMELPSLQQARQPGAKDEAEAAGGGEQAKSSGAPKPDKPSRQAMDW